MKNEDLTQVWNQGFLWNVVFKYKLKIREFWLLHRTSEHLDHQEPVVKVISIWWHDTFYPNTPRVRQLLKEKVEKETEMRNATRDIDNELESIYSKFLISLDKNSTLMWGE